MVEVRFESQDDTYIAIIQGHAGYNPGNDIVCAAVSTLAYTLAGALSNVIGVSTRLEDSPGDLTCIAVVDSHNRRYDITVREVETIFKTIQIGLMQIQAKYPENIFLFLDDFDNM